MATTATGEWSNWSGSVKSEPRQISTPRSIDELAGMIKEFGHTGRHVRVVGAGHSFTPLVQTKDVLISLDRMQGIESVDTGARTAIVLGGTKLKYLGETLFDYGMAQENLGDIDVQSIAGAISTGTHGTGTDFGTIATQVEGLTLITATGEILECSPTHNADIFKAAQVSLGTLGVIARVKLRLVPAQRLHYHAVSKKLSDCLTHLDQYKQENSHFEFFWFPYTDGVQAKFLNETEQPVSKSNLWGDFNKIVLENGVYWLLSEACRHFPRLCKTVCQISAQSIASIDEVNYSHRLFATPRLVRFQEMEYNIPSQYMRVVLDEIRDCIEKYQFQVNFPVECRFVRADDIWLSPAYQRDSAYIAVHMYRGMPYQDYFKHIEAIFRAYDGRPHWGKMHTRTASELETLYPRWHDFRRIRAELDPQGIFLNDYLRALFAADAPVASSAAVETD